MTSPVARLDALKLNLRNVPGNDTAQRQAQLDANIECAIVVAETLIGLNVAVNDMSQRAVTVLGNLTTAIENATAQSALSSNESTGVAKESAKLSKQLNRLTLGIIIAAVLSAIAAARSRQALYFTESTNDPLLMTARSSPCGQPHLAEEQYDQLVRNVAAVESTHSLAGAGYLLERWPWILLDFQVIRPSDIFHGQILFRAA